MFDTDSASPTGVLVLLLTVDDVLIDLEDDWYVLCLHDPEWLDVG